MTKSKLVLLISVVIMLCLGLLACSPYEEGTASKTNVEYKIEVSSIGGMPIREIGVYVYTDGTCSDLVWKADTDENGSVSFTALSSDEYVAVLENVPEGYKKNQNYQLTSDNTVISLETELLEAGDMTEYHYELGSIVRDFSITSVDGNVYNVSELLKDKKAVVLNFWFLNCGPCKIEFPYLEMAYEEYSDELEVIALNPVDGTNSSIKEFADELGLKFPMSKCEPQWEACMRLTAYPTTVVIDRYGMISMIHKGSITDKESFVKIFDFYTSDDYIQTTLRNISDISDN